MLWTANTERFAELRDGLNDTAANLMASIEANDSEIAPSTLFAVACILEGVTYVSSSSLSLSLSLSLFLTCLP